MRERERNDISKGSALRRRLEMRAIGETDARQLGCARVRRGSGNQIKTADCASLSWNPDCAASNSRTKWTINCAIGKTSWIAPAQACRPDILPRSCFVIEHFSKIYPGLLWQAFRIKATSGERCIEEVRRNARNGRPIGGVIRLAVDDHLLVRDCR